MKHSVAMLLVLCAITTLAGEAEDVTEFFDNTKIGRGADYGVYKRDTDHVISIHGFTDDLSVCLEIIALFNQKESGTYTCKPLNH